jgi:hypothetical protein
MNSAAINRLAGGDAGSIHSSMMAHPRLPDHKAIGVTLLTTKTAIPAGTQMYFPELPRTATDSRWPAYRAAVERLRRADQANGIWETDNIIWARFKSAAAETFGIAVRRNRCRRPRRSTKDKKGSSAWSLNYKQMSHCWKRMKRRLNGACSAGPCVVKSSDGRILVGEEAHAAVLEYTQTLYQHPSARMSDTEWDAEWCDISHLIRETVKDLPKVQWSGCEFPAYEVGSLTSTVVGACSLVLHSFIMTLQGSE